MAQKRWTLRILDAKAAHRAWSKRRVLVAIAAAAIAASVASPMVVRADVVTNTPSVPAATQTVAAGDAKPVGITITRTDDGYTQGSAVKISMTNKRAYKVTVPVEGVDVDTLQQMIDNGRRHEGQASRRGRPLRQPLQQHRDEGRGGRW